MHISIQDSEGSVLGEGTIDQSKPWWEEFAPYQEDSALRPEGEDASAKLEPVLSANDTPKQQRPRFFFESSLLSWSPSLETPVKPPINDEPPQETPFWVRSQRAGLERSTRSSSPIPLFEEDSENEYDSLFPVFSQTALQVIDKTANETTNVRSAQLSPEDDVSNPFFSFEKTSQKPEHSAGFLGFTKASGAACLITPQSLDKARKMFGDEFDSAEGSCLQQELKPSLSPKMAARGTTEDPNSFKTPSKTPLLTGFTTASKKPISVKPALLESAKSFLGDDEETGTHAKRPLMEPRQNTATTPSLAMFSTASNKPIAVKRESVEFAERMMEEKPESSLLTGFSTASKKQITVAKESMRALLGEDSASNLETPTTKRCKPDFPLNSAQKSEQILRQQQPSTPSPFANRAQSVRPLKTPESRRVAPTTTPSGQKVFKLPTVSKTPTPQRSTPPAAPIAPTIFHTLESAK